MAYRSLLIVFPNLISRRTTSAAALDRSLYNREYNDGAWIKGASMRRVLLSVCLAFGLGGEARAEEAPRIADLWFAHNEVTAMLGASDRVVATVARPDAYPWLYRMSPALSGAKVFPAGAPEPETLLATGASLVFIPSDVSPEPARAVGLKVFDVSFSDTRTMGISLDTTAEVLGTERARTAVADYKAHLAEILRRVGSRVDGLPDDKRPRVLHLASIEPLRADGAETIIDEWIRRAGGRNAADGLVGNLKNVSLEQLIKWQPDLIIVGGNNKALPTSGGGWEALNAVREGRVLRNPMGVFNWDRYSTEFALQVLWTAKAIHPQQFADVDLPQEVRSFYKRHFGYDVSDDDANRILSALPPK
jgi:iron complex transport system substrate-binding protein